MARRQTFNSNQYGLDFESAGTERLQLLMSALQVTGLMRYQQVARLVLYMQEQAGGDPLGWPIARYSNAMGKSDRTVQRWLKELESIGLIEVIDRPRERGGQQTNLVAVNWPIVRLFALDRIAAKRGDKKRVTPRCNSVTPPRSPVTPIVSPPIKELSTYSSSSSSESLPHAIAEPATTSPIGSEEEEEIFLKRLSAACREHLKKQAPRRLVPALRQALANGCTQTQLRERCRWFIKHQFEWRSDHDERAGAFHDGLYEATPDIRADQCWPYQR